MPATTAYPRGALVPSDKKMPEMRAERDSTKISGPRPAGDERTPPATASASTAALMPTASQVRAGQRGGDCAAVTEPANAGGARLAGHMLGEPLTGNRVLVPQAGDPAVREDRRVDRAA